MLIQNILKVFNDYKQILVPLVTTVFIKVFITVVVPLFARVGTGRVRCVQSGANRIAFFFCQLRPVTCSLTLTILKLHFANLDCESG